MSNLDIIHEILHDKYMPIDQERLIEKNNDRKKQSFEMNFKIVKRPGIHYKLYRYDAEALPFFKDGLSDLKKMCDYIIFAEDESEVLYIFLIELKLGQEPALKQLNAAKEFVKFLVNSTIRIGKNIDNYKIKKIRICEKNVQKRTKTNLRLTIEPSFKFNEDDYCEYRLSEFKLYALMQNA